MSPRVLILLVLLLAASCAGEQSPADEPLTQRQRDSAIAASGLPGARGIQRALDTADSVAARTARLDSLARSQ